MRDVDAMSGDLAAIDRLAAAFFGLFSNRGGVVPDLGAIHALCVPQAVISRCSTPAPEVFSSVAAFIAPRQQMLTDGTLTDFAEAETDARTRVFGNIAQRVCTYEKSGALEGKPFQARGVKVFQFIRGTGGWRIAAVAWDDEREGLAFDQLARQFGT